MKIAPFIAQSMTKGSGETIRRSPATKVTVFQCPQETQPMSRRPRLARPRVLTSNGEILAVVEDALRSHYAKEVEGIYLAVTIRETFQDHAAYLVHRRDNARVLTTTGQMLFTMALFRRGSRSPSF